MWTLLAFTCGRGWVDVLVSDAVTTAAAVEFCYYDWGTSGWCEDCPANASCEDQEECEGGDYYYNYEIDLPKNETGIEI